MMKCFLLAGLLLGIGSLAQAQDRVIAVNLSIAADSHVKLVRLYEKRGVVSAQENVNKTNPAYFIARILDDDGHSLAEHDFLADVSGTIVDNFEWGKGEQSPFPSQAQENITFPLVAQSGTLVVEHQGKRVLEHPFTLSKGKEATAGMLRKSWILIGAVFLVLLGILFLSKRRVQ